MPIDDTTAATIGMPITKARSRKDCQGLPAQRSPSLAAVTWLGLGAGAVPAGAAGAGEAWAWGGSGSVATDVAGRTRGRWEWAWRGAASTAWRSNSSWLSPTLATCEAR